MALAGALVVVGFSQVQVAQATTDCSSLPAAIFAGGDGGVANPYQVDDLKALDEIRCYLDKNFVLVEDIEIPAGYGGAGGWTPIAGSSPNVFTGSFDGKGHSIIGLVIDAKLNAATPTEVGLFGNTSRARISNLELESAEVVGGNSCGSVGVLVGSADYTQIQNTTVTNSSVDGSCGVGGLVGRSFRSSLSDINVDVTVNLIPNSSGGIGGNIGGLIGTAIESSVLNATVDSNIRLLSNETTPGVSRDIAGVVGESRNSIFSRVNLKTLIRATTNVQLQRLSGFAGSSQNFGQLSDSVLDIDIDIRGAAGANEISCITMIVGFSSSISDLDVVCKLAVGDNAQSISAGFRQLNDGSAVNRLQLHADLTIGEDPSGVGFLAAAADTSFMKDSIFTGSMNIAASTAASNVGLIVGSAGSAIPVLTSQTIVAIATNLDEIGGTNVGGAAGADSASQTRAPVLMGMLVDKDLLGFELSAEALDVARVTTSDLQSSSYLAAAGFDFDDIWQLAAGEYPKLRFGPKIVIETVTLSPSVVPLSLTFLSQIGSTSESKTLSFASNYNQVSAKLAQTNAVLFTKATTTGFEVLVPSDLSAGSYDLVISSPGGTATVQDAIKIESGQPQLQVSIKRNQDDSVRIFAKNVVGAGKIQFIVNGQEIAWIRAKNQSDTKLRSTPGGEYLVRTVQLEAGKNIIEVYQDGERLRRVAHTR